MKMAALILVPRTCKFGEVVDLLSHLLVLVPRGKFFFFFFRGKLIGKVSADKKTATSWQV